MSDLALTPAPDLYPVPTRVPPLKVLHFDIENRPLAYWYEGQTTAEVTAIAWCWSDRQTPQVRLRTLDPDSLEKMLQDFKKAYNEADVVTGHYIRRHDLPLLNGAFLEQLLPGLGPKLVSDTQTDLDKRKDLSASQESLAAMLCLPEPKHSMTQADWREANRLTPAGLNLTAQRCVSDVVQHKALRRALIQRGLLRAPSVWEPGR